MAAPENNDFNEYPIDEMKKLIKKYAEHIKNGFSKESFPPCDYRTIERHLTVHADELQSEKKEVAEAFRMNRMWWEERGIKGLMVGKRFNATTWIFNMKNRFKDEWMDKMVREDTAKIDANVNHSGNITVKFGGSNSIHPPQQPGKDTPSNTE